MKRQRLGLFLTFSILAICLMFFGQACTRPVKFFSSSIDNKLNFLSEASTAEGNGGTYGGKLVILHHEVPGFQCEGHDNPESILLRKPDMNWYYSKNSVDKCKTVNQQPVTGVQYDEATQIVTYMGASYKPPLLYKVVSSENPNLPDVDLEDGVCADANGVCSLLAAVNQIAPMEFAKEIRIFISAGTYLLSTPLLINNTNKVTITGENKDTTILDGGDSLRILNISHQAGSLSSAPLAISNLTFTRGFSSGTNSWGGGLLVNYGLNDVTIDSCKFIGNHAEHAGAALSIHGQSVGGIAYVRRSIFQQNSLTGASPQVIDSDAITATGSLVLEDSLISDNGIPSKNYPVVRVSTGGPFVLKSTSIVNNISTGLSYYLTSCTNSPCSIENSTIARNNGNGISIENYRMAGWADPQDFSIINTTVAQNNLARGLGPSNLYLNTGAGFHLISTVISSLDSATETNCSLTRFFLSGGYSIANDNSCEITNMEPLLSALANNGGIGLTMMPQTSSPLLGYGFDCLLDDQRHVLRSNPTGSCTVGALEVP